MSTSFNFLLGLTQAEQPKPFEKMQRTTKLSTSNCALEIIKVLGVVGLNFNDPNSNPFNIFSVAIVSNEQTGARK